MATHEEDPETYKKLLRKALIEALAEQVQTIVKVAERVMHMVQLQQAALGKYNIQTTGNIYGSTNGDYQQVTMEFGDIPKEH